MMAVRLAARGHRGRWESSPSSPWRALGSAVVRGRRSVVVVGMMMMMMNNKTACR